MDVTEWPWWVTSNSRRGDLISKKYEGGGLTPEEKIEYTILSCLADLICNLHESNAQ